MRCDKTAICTSGEPVSASDRRNSPIISCLRSFVIDMSPSRLHVRVVQNATLGEENLCLTSGCVRASQKLCCCAFDNSPNLATTVEYSTSKGPLAADSIESSDAIGQCQSHSSENRWSFAGGPNGRCCEMPCHS